MTSCTHRWPPRLVVVPGLHGSEDAHWQTWLERQFPQSIRVAQRDWDRPDLDDWSDALEQRLADERGPFILAAHSFGCLVSAQAIGRGIPNIVGALFVAPANPVRFGVESRLNRAPLGVTSILIASENDPWMGAADAGALAGDWQASFASLGHAGHINVASGFGPWPRAKYLVDTLAHWAAPKYLNRSEVTAPFEWVE